MDKFICFYINLEKCVERGEHCKQLLNTLEFDEIHHIIPIDKYSREIYESEMSCVNCFGKYKGKPRGAKSLSMTTKKLLQHISTLPDNFYFIFEDDIDINDNIDPKQFKTMVNNDIKQYPTHNMFYLGQIFDDNALHNHKRNKFKSNMGWGTHAYMINPKGAILLLNRIHCWHAALDGTYRRMVTPPAPLLGIEYRNNRQKDYFGYFIQGRNCEWYTPSDIPVAFRNGADEGEYDSD